MKKGCILVFLGLLLATSASADPDYNNFCMTLKTPAEARDMLKAWGTETNNRREAYLRERLGDEKLAAVLYGSLFANYDFFNAEIVDGKTFCATWTNNLPYFYGLTDWKAYIHLFASITENTGQPIFWTSCDNYGSCRFYASVSDRSTYFKQVKRSCAKSRANCPRENIQHKESPPGDDVRILSWDSPTMLPERIGRHFIAERRRLGLR